MTEKQLVYKFYPTLEDIAKRNGFIENYEIIIESDEPSVKGYSSSIYEARIVSKDNKVLNLIIKSCESHDKIRSVIPIDSIFKRERYMYETVFPAFQQFEIDRGLQPTQFAATYYHINNDYDGDLVILSNLKELGYSLYDTRRLLDDEHMQLVMKNYGKLHAISFAYQEQNPTKFQSLTEPLVDNLFSQVMKIEGYKEMFIKQLKKGAESLDSDLHRKVKIVYEKFISDVETFMLNIPSMADEYTAVIHGDCWINNMMFKYDDLSRSTTPTEARLLDFQISRVASPMLDIANFFYGCASPDVVDNMHAYLKMYYDALSNRLRELGSNPEQVYPFSVMMDHWKKFARYGLIIRFSILSILFSDEKERKGLSDVIESTGCVSNMLNYSISDIEKYHDVSRHTITHFVENGLI